MLNELLYISVVAIVCALLGLSTSRYSRGGLIVYLAFGFIGAFAGSWISRSLNFSNVPDLTIGATKFPVIWALVGAVLLVAAIGMIVKER